MIAEMLAEARKDITRYTPAQAVAADALLVDLRSQDERERNEIIPDSVHVPRSVLEWRCDPDSGWANPHLAGKALIPVCAEGCSSSLAAASLRRFGLDAGDLVGGFEAWRAAGQRVVPAPPRDEGLAGMRGPR